MVLPIHKCLIYGLTRYRYRTILTYSNVGDLVVVILCRVDLLYSCPPTRVQDAVVQYSFAAGIQDLRIKDCLCLFTNFFSTLACYFVTLHWNLEVHYHTKETSLFS